MFSRIKTIRQAYDQFTAMLQQRYDEHEARSITGLVFEEVLGFDTIRLITDDKELLPASYFEQLDLLLHQLMEYKPVQYVLGKAFFYGLVFRVNEQVLIPRPETEELVQWILQDLERNPRKGLRLLDIGTGSGCISVTIKKNSPGTRVHALDISPGALRTAAENARLIGVDVYFTETDILQADTFDFSPLDVIVSNPPYVRHSEKAIMGKNVLDYEPHLALFVDDEDALLFYERIADVALKNLAPMGALYLEINEAKGEEVVEMLGRKGFAHVELRQDLPGKDRMVKAQIS